MLREGRSSLFRALLIMGLSAAFASAGVAQVKQVALSASLLDNPKLFWRAVMTSFYGQYNKTLKCWVGRDDKQTAYCMRPIKLDTVEGNGGKAVYLSIGGQALGRDGALNYTGADGQGAVGLIVMSQEGKRLVTSATNSLYASAGTFGQMVSGPREDNVLLRKIGEDTWAWFIESGIFYSGNGAFSYAIVAPIGDKVVSVGRIPSSMFQDDAGACKPKCANLTADIIIDSQDGTKRFYPIIVRVHDRVDASMVEGTFQVPFNDDKLQYDTPGNLIELMRNPYTE